MGTISESTFKWYYEEREGRGKAAKWISAFFDHGLTYDRAVELMEARKKKAPRAVLRLCYQETTRAPYRYRHQFNQGPF